MVVVALAAVAAEVVELAEFLGVVAAVVQRVEDRDAVRGQRDRAAQEVRLGRQRFLGRHRVQGNPPGALAGVGLRDRHLLLPGFDARHQRVVGEPLRLDVEILLVPADADLGREGREGRRERRGRSGGAGGGRQEKGQAGLGDRRLRGGAMFRIERGDVGVGGGGEEQGRPGKQTRRFHDTVIIRRPALRGG